MLFRTCRLRTHFSNLAKGEPPPPHPASNPLLPSPTPSPPHYPTLTSSYKPVFYNDSYLFCGIERFIIELSSNRREFIVCKIATRLAKHFVRFRQTRQVGNRSDIFNAKRRNFSNPTCHKRATISKFLKTIHFTTTMLCFVQNLYIRLWV